MDDTKINVVTAGREYENFEPKIEVIHGDDKETIVIYLPGFKKSQLRLQLTPSRFFKVSGERQVTANRWSRFVKEYPASANVDLNRVTAKFENETLSIIQPKLIAKVADEEKPAGAESTPPAPPKSAERPANGQAAQAKPKQKDEGSNNNGRAKPLEDDPLKQKQEPKISAAQKKSSKEYSSCPVAPGRPAADAETPVPAKKETDEKMKGTVAEDDGAVEGKARKTSDGQKHGNGNSLARTGGWTKTLMTVIASKPRMAVNVVLVVVVALLLGLYLKRSPTQ